MLPESIPTVTVTAHYLTPDGRPLSGTVAFEPPSMLTHSATDVMLGGPIEARLDDDGRMQVTLPATDTPGMNPESWAYTVTERLSGVPGRRPYKILLPAEHPRVDLAEIAPADPGTPDYVPVAGPAGPPGDKGAPGSRILTGDTPPAENLGSSGDLMLRTDTGDLWQRGENDWGKPVGNFMGPQGAPGTGNVDTVNGKPGPDVKLTAEDVGALSASGGSVAGNVVIEGNGSSHALVVQAGSSYVRVNKAGDLETSNNAYISSNLRVGSGAGKLAGAAGAIQLANGAAPAEAVEDGVSLYSAGGKLFVQRADGSVVEVGEGQTGPRGPEGPQGPAGADGASSNDWAPEDLGFVAWSFDPGLGDGKSAINASYPGDIPASGRIYYSAVVLRKAAVVKNVCVQTLGYSGGSGGITAGSFAGIYDASGKRRAQTADLSKVYPETHEVGGATSFIPLSSAVTLQPGIYVIALLLTYSNSANSPRIMTGNGGYDVPGRFGRANAVPRTALSPTKSNTSLPASVNWSTGVGALGTRYWMALA